MLFYSATEVTERFPLVRLLVNAVLQQLSWSGCQLELHLRINGSCLKSEITCLRERLLQFLTSVVSLKCRLIWNWIINFRSVLNIRSVSQTLRQRKRSHDEPYGVAEHKLNINIDEWCILISNLCLNDFAFLARQQWQICFESDLFPIFSNPANIPALSKQ